MVFKYSILKDYLLVDFFNELHFSSSKYNQLLLNKKISLNSSVVTSENTALKIGDCLYIDTTIFDTSDITPEYFELTILYEDDYLLVIDKPRNTIIYDLDGGIGLNNYVAYYYSLKGIDLIPRHLQRLDKDTTGCIIYCKDILSLCGLSYDLENFKITKKYYALVNGTVKKNFVIDKPIGKNRHDSKKMIVSSVGKPAVTEFEIIKNLNNKTLISCKLLTGRKHQIRVHLSSLNLPIIGDKLYGNPDDKNELCLDCYYVSFTHPITKEKVVIEKDNSFNKYL